ncbi:MAG: hypothetical protein ACKVJU_05295 [Verrucomicrobiales bacterium]
MGLSVRGTDYSRICFDVKDKKFTQRAPDGKRYISVSELWQESFWKIVQNVEDEHRDALDSCNQILKTYPISIVQVRDKNLSEVCDIFQRINQAGKRLYRFDLISEMTFSRDFDLRERFQEDIIDPLKTKAFGKISSDIVTQLMALIKLRRCTESIQFSLTADEIHGMWPKVISSIKLAADTLRKCVGVMDASFLPYDSQLTLLTYLFAKSGKHALSEIELVWFQGWFWLSSFSRHYGSRGATRVGQDSELFDQLIAGSSPDFSTGDKVDAKHVDGDKDDIPFSGKKCVPLPVGAPQTTRPGEQRAFGSGNRRNFRFHESGETPHFPAGVSSGFRPGEEGSRSPKFLLPHGRPQQKDQWEQALKILS